MKIQVTFDFGPDERFAISHQVGDPKPATYDDCRRWIEMTVRSTIEVIRAEWERQEDEPHEPK